MRESCRWNPTLQGKAGVFGHLVNCHHNYAITRACPKRTLDSWNISAPPSLRQLQNDVLRPNFNDALVFDFHR